jgi:hypothetical protein
VTVECRREQDVIDAIGAARWPDRCEDELRRHVAGCEICADLVEILGPMSREQDAAWDEARVPPAQLVWWRAQLRAREEALCAATRPLTAVYALALVFVGALLGGTVATLLPRLRAWAGAAAASMQWPSTDALTQLVAPLAGSTVVLLALATWLLLAPLIVWLVVSGDTAD